MGEYRKKPVVIEALQFTGDNLDEIQNFVGFIPEHDGKMPAFRPYIMPSSEVKAKVWDKLHLTWVGVKNGQWIIKGIQGEFYPCDPDVFSESYELVDDDVSDPAFIEPTEPGFYIYDSGKQNTVFLLVAHNLGQMGAFDAKFSQWYALFDNGTFDKCHWDYIEQALSVYRLKRIDEVINYNLEEKDEVPRSAL